MQIIIHDVKLKFDGHKTIIITLEQYNWFERNILGYHNRVQTYKGHGSVWQEYPTGRVSPKSVAKQLQEVEQSKIFNNKKK